MNNSKLKPNVLIVDDEIYFRESLEMGIEDSFTVYSVGSLKEAREFIKKKCRMLSYSI